MAAGIPYLTLDAAGRPVALFDDGTVQPLPLTGDVRDASNRPPGTARSSGQRLPTIRPAAGATRLSGRGGPAGGGATTSRAADGDAAREAIPPPSGGGPGSGIDVRARLASARARLSGAIGGASGYSASGGIPQPERPDRLRGRYARGLDPTQAAGLTLQPTAMLPRVLPGLTPADPLYGRLADLPAAQMATLMGGQGTPEDIANNLGKLYERAATRGWLPSTDRLLKNLSRGKGVATMFEGQRAGPNDMESYSQPGYVYGAEPMPMGEAAYTYGGLLDAALFQEPLLTAQKYGVESGGWGSYLVDTWASKAMKKPPGKSKPIYKSVGRKLFR